MRTGHCTTTVRRIARKRIHCSWGDCQSIEPGEVYLLHTEYPGGEAGYADAAGRPVRAAECADCARRYGRAKFLDGAA